MSLLLAIFLMLFAVIGGIGKVGFGFGAGVILNPLLALFIPSASAVTLLAPILWFSNFAGMNVHRKAIDWHLIKRMLPASLIGVLTGSITVTYMDDRILKVIIGIVAIVMGFLLLLSRKKGKGDADDETAVSSDRPSEDKIKGKVIRQAGSFAAGFAGSAANSGGLPLTVLFLSDRSMTKTTFAANMVVMLAIMDSIKIIAYLILGILTIKNVLLVVIYIPFIYLGAYIGKGLHTKISERAFFGTAYSMIFITGLLLLL